MWFVSSCLWPTMMSAQFGRFVVEALVAISWTVKGTPKLSRYGWMSRWKSKYLALVELTSTIASAPVVAPEAGIAPARQLSSASVIRRHRPARKNLLRGMGRGLPWTMAEERITASEGTSLRVVVWLAFLSFRFPESPLCLAQKVCLVQNDRS